MTADSLASSGVLAAEQMERAFQRERARVERNEQCFSLAVFRMPPGKTTGSVRETVAEAAAVLMNRIRSYDDVGVVDDRSLAVLLPETNGTATWTFVDGALEDLKSKGLTAACEVYTYPHLESREEQQDEGSDSTDAYNDYGRVDHPQKGVEMNHGPAEPEPTPPADSGENESSLGHSSERRTDAAHSSGAHSHLRGQRSQGTQTLLTALSATAVMERPALRAITDRNHSMARADRCALHAVMADSISFSAGPLALAASYPPMEEAPRPMKWSQRSTRTAQQPAAAQATETRKVRDLAPYFEERLPLYRRAVDIAVAGTALTLLSPVLITGALLVKLTSPGPIIFAQPRAGRGGRPFQFYKLRSMYRDAEERKNALRLVNEKDGPIFKIKNDPRITPVGKVIRKFSIDELPQLFNVLKGDMTLVGPRPPVLDEVKEYETWQRQRLDITGGITCIWQVSGRSEVTFREWMRMDVRYRKQRSLGLDLKLIWKTFGAVFSGKGAY